MKWYDWVIIYFIIIIIINWYIKHLAKKNNIYEIMESFSEKETKGKRILLLLIIIVPITYILDYYKAFESSTITIIFFAGIAILSGIVDNLTKYIHALDCKKRNIYVDTSISGYEKDKMDQKNKVGFLTKLAIFLTVFSLTNKHRHKRK